VAGYISMEEPLPCWTMPRFRVILPPPIVQEASPGTTPAPAAGCILMSAELSPCRVTPQFRAIFPHQRQEVIGFPTLAAGYLSEAEPS